MQKNAIIFACCILLVSLHGILCWIDSALMESCRKDDVNKVKKFLEENPELLNHTISGLTPIMAAVIAGSKSTVSFLINKGADVSIPDSKNYTVMHAAANHGRDKIVKILIEAGIEKNEMHEDGFRLFISALCNLNNCTTCDMLCSNFLT